MGRVHYSEEQIIAKLRKAELLFAEGKSKAQVCKAQWVYFFPYQTKEI
jgi:hypothetical protein